MESPAGTIGHRSPIGNHPPWMTLRSVKSLAVQTLLLKSPPPPPGTTPKRVRVKQEEYLFHRVVVRINESGA